MIERCKEASHAKDSECYWMIHEEITKETYGDKCQEKRYCGQNKFKN